MVTATTLAVFFIPLFFVVVVQLFEKRRQRPDGDSPGESIRPTEES
jgi:multidrug efflux pump